MQFNSTARYHNWVEQERTICPDYGLESLKNRIGEEQIWYACSECGLCQLVRVGITELVPEGRPAHPCVSKTQLSLF